MLIQLTLSFSSAKDRFILKIEKIFINICYIIGTKSQLLPEMVSVYGGWSRHWASWVETQTFYINSDPGKCKRTFPGLPISLVSY